MDYYVLTTTNKPTTSMFNDLESTTVQIIIFIINLILTKMLEVESHTHMYESYAYMYLL